MRGIRHGVADKTDVVVGAPPRRRGAVFSVRTSAGKGPIYGQQRFGAYPTFNLLPPEVKTVNKVATVASGSMLLCHAQGEIRNAVLTGEFADARVAATLGEFVLPHNKGADSTNTGEAKGFGRARNGSTGETSGVPLTFKPLAKVIKRSPFGVCTISWKGSSRPCACSLYGENRATGPSTSTGRPQNSAETGNFMRPIASTSAFRRARCHACSSGA
jgi:hypothetical protein